MKALVTGATGFIGQHLIRHLLAEGWQVRALCRPTSQKPDDFAQKIEWRTGDIGEPEVLQAAVADIDVVYHLAGVTKAPDGATFNRINVQGTVNLLETLIHHGQPGVRFIYVSSLSASGPSSPWSPKREDEPCYPVSLYGQSKLAAEIEVLKRKNKIWCAIIRPAIVYGPGDKESLIFFKIAKSHLNPHLGLEKRYISMIYISDLINLLWQVAMNDQPSGEIYFACDEQSNGYNWNHVIAAAAQALKCRSLNIYLPFFVLSTMLLPAQILAKINHRQASLNRDKYRELRQLFWTCSAAKAGKLIGYKAQVELTEGLDRAAIWYQEQKWI